MSIRCFVNIQENQKFITSPNGCFKLLFGHSLQDEEDRPYIDLHVGLPETKSLPANIAEITTGVSYYEPNLIEYGSGRRITGEYRYRSAFGVLENNQHNGINKQGLRITADNIVDASELYSRVRSGRIYPAVSYDAAQVPVPMRRFKDLAREFAEMLGDLLDDCRFWFAKTT